MREPLPKTKRVCLFCEKGKLSDEHILSQWTHKLLPASQASKWTEFAIQVEGGIPLSQTPLEHKNTRTKKTRSRVGSIRNFKPLTVCRPCNHGWMKSDIEERVRPILTKIITGERTEVSADDQTLLAQWFTLKMIVLDGSNRTLRAFNQFERTAFMESRSIPEGLEVWLLWCGFPPWTESFLQITLGSQNENEPRKLKSTTIGIGHALFHGVLLRDQNFSFSLNSIPIRLHPTPDPVRRWPTFQRLSAVGATALAENLDRITGADIEKSR
jgi:hypothetical protein